MKRIIKQFKTKLNKEHPAAELKSFALFGKMNMQELKIIHELMYERHYQAGEKLYEAGFPSELVFFIKEGEVCLIQGDASEPFRRLQAGDILGFENEHKHKRSHNAIANSDLRVLAISKRDLQDLRKNIGDLARKLNAAILLADANQAGENSVGTSE